MLITSTDKKQRSKSHMFECVKIINNNHIEMFDVLLTETRFCIEGAARQPSHFGMYVYVCMYIYTYIYIYMYIAFP